MLQLDHISYLGIILILVLSGAGFPVPEELPVALAGVASKMGQLNPTLAFLACLVGALGGDTVMYAVGYIFGKNVLRDHPLMARFLTREREEQIERQLNRHGVKVFLVARFLPGFRSAAYLTAGILHVSFWRFLLLDVICALAVIGLTFGVSYVFADQIVSVFGWIRRLETGAAISVGLVLLCALVYYWDRRRRRRTRLAERKEQRAKRLAAVRATVGEFSANAAATREGA